jgi:hypothetical protein
MLIVNARICTCGARAVRRMTHSKMVNFSTSIVGGFSLADSPSPTFGEFLLPTFGDFLTNQFCSSSFINQYDFLELGNMIKRIVFI